MHSSGEIIQVKSALISVSDKNNIQFFAAKLKKLEVEILSSGGTSAFLEEGGIKTESVSNYTGFPEILDGRVKTLHPKIYGGILGRTGKDDPVMQNHNIKKIDLVVVNLYPFESTVAKSDCSLEDAIENIDIGGPSMIRAAAKNYKHTVVVVDPKDYRLILDEIDQNQGIKEETRLLLAVKAFNHTAKYDKSITHYLDSLTSTELVLLDKKQAVLPDELTLSYSKISDLRYGENPHQLGAFYTEKNPSSSTLATSKFLQGKELSYNNIVDADAALSCAKSFQQPACVIVKHANPCGVALGDNATSSYDLAFKADPVSAFGGIIAFNTPVDEICAKKIMNNQFVEVIIAPGFNKKALDVFSAKKNIRVINTGPFKKNNDIEYVCKSINGGMLIQSSDKLSINAGDLKIVGNEKPSDEIIKDLLFAWNVVKHVKSNAIVYAKDNITLGIGAGQMSRLYSAKIAVMKAKEQNFDLKNSVVASDAFFPFADTVVELAKDEVKAIIQPGGSIRDKEIIKVAQDKGIIMAFTGVRHFFH